MPDSSMATFMLSHEEESKTQNSQRAKRQEMHDDFCMYTPEELPLELKVLLQSNTTNLSSIDWSKSRSATQLE